MDVKEMIEKVVDKVKNDKGFMTKLQENPVKALEELLGVNLPDEKADQVLKGVKDKIVSSGIEGAVHGVEEKVEGVLGGLFHKKD